MSRTETVRLHAGDTLALIRDALRGLRSIYVPGHKYWKAGVMLNDVIEAKSAPAQMFPSRDPRQSARLMATMDAVNGRFGRGTIRPAVSGVERRWSAKAEYLSPRYTTRADELVSVLSRDDLKPKFE
jgi:DNA polymerase V